MDYLKRFFNLIYFQRGGEGADGAAGRGPGHRGRGGDDHANH